MHYIIKVLNKAFSNWSRNANPREAACIAFYTIFSLAPTLVIGVFIAGLILGKTAAKEEVINQVQQLVGSEGAEAIQTVLNNVTHLKTGLFAGTLGLLILLYGASKVFAEMRYALNKIFRVRQQDRPTKTKLLSLLRGRLLGFALVVSLGFFLLVSLCLSALLNAFSAWLVSYENVSMQFLASLNFLISVLLIGTLFSFILKILPESKVPWRYAFSGAFVSAITFSVGKDLIGLYLGNSGISSSYGAAGSAIVLLIWVYFTAQTLLLGAEIAHAQVTLAEEKKAN